MQKGGQIKIDEFLQDTLSGMNMPFWMLLSRLQFYSRVTLNGYKNPDEHLVHLPELTSTGVTQPSPDAFSSSLNIL